MDGVKLSPEELAGATEIAPVKLSAEEIAGATEIGDTPKERRGFLSEVAHRAREQVEPLAHLSVPTSGTDAWERVKQNIQPAIEGAKGLGRTVLDANAFANRAVLHPVDTFGGGKAGAVGNEVLRGVYGNIPLANLVNERAFGVPEESPEDAAKAPGARAFGAVAAPLAPKAMGAVAEVAAPPVVLVGRTLSKAAKATANVARDIGEGSIERSAARGPVPVGNVIDSVKKTIAKATEDGHMSVPAAAERAAIVSADEAVAAIARRLMKADPTEVGPMTSTEWTPRRTEPLPPSWRPRAKPMAPVDPNAVPPGIVREEVGPLQGAGWDPEGWKYDQAKPVTPEVASSKSAVPVELSPIEMARAALKDATPAQAEVLKKAIAGYQARAAKAEAAAPPAPAGEPRAPRVDAEEMPAGAVKSPEAIAQKARPEMWGGRPSNVERPAPEWSPGPGDEKFAKKLNMSVDDYRALMTKRSSYNAAVERLARLARSSSNPDEFVRASESAGITAKDARKIWEAAHPQKGATP